RVVGDIDRDVEDGLFAAAEPLRPTERDVKRLLPFRHLGEGLASDRALNRGFHVVDTHTPVVAALAVNRELEVGLPFDSEDADVLNPWDSVERVFHLIGEEFQLIEIGSDDLDRVIPLDSRERLHDIVPDVLREIPIYANQISAQIVVHLLDKLWLSARPQSME